MAWFSIVPDRQCTGTMLYSTSKELWKPLQSSLVSLPISSLPGSLGYTGRCLIICLNCPKDRTQSAYHEKLLVCAQNKTDLKHLDSRPGFSLSQHSENVSSASSSPSAFLGLTMLETVMPNCSNKTKPSCDASKKNRNFQKSPEQGLAHEVFALNWGVWRKFRGNTQAFEHFITLSP